MTTTAVAGRTAWPVRFDGIQMAPWPGIALIQRDLLRSLRRIRPFVLVVILVLIQVYVAVVQYPRGPSAFMRAGAAADALFYWFVMITMVTGAILLPSAAGTSVVLEREQETFDLVRLTMMRRSTFVLSKTINAWGYFGVFVLASMPVGATLFFLVGIEVKQIVFATMILLAASIALASIGVAASCHARHSMRALLTAYLLGLFFMGGHVLMLVGLQEMGWIQGTFISQVMSRTWLFAMAPPASFVAIHDGTYGYDLLWRALLYHGVVSAFFLFWAWLGIHKPDTGTEGKEWRRVRRFRPIPDWANPIAVKERRWSMGLRMRGMWMLVIFAHVYFVFMSKLAVSMIHGDKHSGALACAFGFALLCLLVPVLLVNTLTREKDLMNLDMLRLTMLSDKQIVLGKVWSGGRYIVMMLPGLAVCYFAVAAGEPQAMSPAKMMMGMVTGCACLFFFSGLSVWIAARSARTASAMVASYASGFAVGIGLPILFGLIASTLFRSTGEGLVGVVCILSPFLGWVISLNDSDYIGAWLLSLILYVGMGVLFFRRALRRYLLEAPGNDWDLTPSARESN